MNEELEIHATQPEALGVTMVGPFEEYRVTLDGFRVPFLRAWPVNAQQTQWSVTLEPRSKNIVIPAEFLTQFIDFVADALAVGHGYFSHPHACQHQGERGNPFGTRMIALSTVPPLDGHPE